MDRRAFILTGLGASLFTRFPALAAGEDQLAELLGELEADPSIVEDSWEYRDRTVSRGVGTGTPSKRKLSQRAIDMIINFEVASPAVYKRKYTRPIWPKGQSGVTIGVGYDLAFATKSYLARDWPMLSDADRKLLEPVLRLHGTAARDAVASVKAVEVPWEPAHEQFLKFLPYPTAQTEAALPNCAKLSDDSFGALVSLIYNRGPGMPRNSKSRVEMLQIRDLMAAQKFDKVPDRIRAMKRLWTTPNSRGLIIRREAEAVLFEMGMKSA